MWKFNRLPAPECLTKNENYKIWGKNYEATKHNWHWHEYNTEKVESILKPLFYVMNANHCSFCDAYRIPRPVAPTIEHFRPKAIFPLLAYTWHNLYLCCNNCQKNPTKFDNSRHNLRKLLRPDSSDYSFHKYFYYDTESGKIEIKRKNLTTKEVEKAELTREYYQLNDDELITSRLEVREDYQDKVDCSKRPYRFMFRDCKEIIEN